MGSRTLPAASLSLVRSRSTQSCCCLNLQFLHTVQGTLKLSQLLIGGLSESLLVSYGMGYSQVIGPAFVSLLTTVTSCLWTTTLLIVCYIFSVNSYGLIRSSLFEPLFSLLASLSFISASAYMLVSVKLYLYPLYLVTIGFASYPAMVAVYMLGFVMAILYGLDAYHSLRYYRGIQ